MRPAVLAMAATVVVALSAATATGVRVVGTTTVWSAATCVIGEVTVVPTNNGTQWTGFTLTNTAASGNGVQRDIYVRVTYDTTGDLVADAAYYMSIPAATYSSPVSLGTFSPGGRKIYANNSYKTVVTSPPSMAGTQFVSFYGLVNAARYEEP